MARRRRNRRNNRGRFAFLYRLLTFVLICGAIVAALALFFKIETIEVSGAQRYSRQEIVDASGVSEGDNLFLMDKYEVAGRIRSALSYVETVQITRLLPSTLRISVTECRDTMALEQDDVLWLIAGTGKIVDTVTPGTATFPAITGLKLTDPVIGETIRSSEDAAHCAVVLDLLQRLREKEMLGDVQAIHAEDPAIVTLRYLDRFDVQIPWDADMDYKLNYLLAVVERLENNVTGTINMTPADRVHYIPG